MKAGSHPPLEMLESFSRFLGDRLLRYELRDPKHHDFHIQPKALPEAVRWLTDQNPETLSLAAIVATDEREKAGCFRLYATFRVQSPQAIITLLLDLDAENPAYPAITPILPVADWMEREIHDLFGITPIHPENSDFLQPLVLHRDWPRGGRHYPMRKDFPADERPEIAEVPHRFQQPQAVGMHQVAVGPIHAGIIEPGHLRFCVTGEQIHQFDAQLFYTHKGIEKMAEGKTYKEALTFAEHVCGLCAFAHSTAYCQAVERLGGIAIPPRALMLRAVFLEMERLASHFADLTAICSAGGFAFGGVHAAHFRETLLTLNRDLTGSRFLRGFNDIGGLKRDIPDDKLRLLRNRLEPIEAEFQRWSDLVLTCDSLLDRLETTGYLSLQQARELGVVGPSARGSGMDCDIRRDFPYGAYAGIEIQVPVYPEGDALARAKVRIDEVRISFGLIRKLLSQIEPGVVYQPMALPTLPNCTIMGLVESAKGELLHWILMGDDNRIERWHVRSASYLNWRGMVQATRQAIGGSNIVPDGPLVNKSFNLCYACTDR